MALKRTLAAVLTVATLSSFSEAQEKVSGDVTVRSLPPGAQVTLSGGAFVSGITPVRFHQILIGDYELVLKKHGYETYTSRVVLDPTKQMEIDVKLSPKTRFKAAARSLFIPGWGQKYTDQKTKGFFFTALAVGSAVAYLLADEGFDDKFDLYEKKLRQYDSTFTAGSVADLRRLKPELDAAQQDAYDAENVRRFTVSMAIAVWGINMLDVLFFFPEERAGFTVKGLAVQPAVDGGKVGITISKSF